MGRHSNNQKEKDLVLLDLEGNNGVPNLCLGCIFFFPRTTDNLRLLSVTVLGQLAAWLQLRKGHCDS